MVRADQIKGER